ncbi:MAG: molecular chaperone HtpG [Eubacteriales bacterium]|nr:molecular chaperone HtpG [Eubacteriales bacterium]
MIMEKGTISINAQNIMPVIKKWLYSDKDIFVREIVSNACDAISKYKLLVQAGKAPDDTYRVDVIADKQAGTLTVSDNGVGMTAEEVKKYIAQVAFSGAEEFLKQYKPEEGDKGGIIGHFGLGFYSAFMVSKKVTVDTLSWQEGAQPALWTSEDGMEYEMSAGTRTSRGTTITMYLNDEDKEFLDLYTLTGVLEKYCAFMPTPIFVREVKPEPAEGEEKKDETAEDKLDKEPQQVNDTSPLWLKKPSECTEEEYREFYHKVFHDFEEPLFWIHLNAEYPFNLKGILYFPKIKNEFSASEGQVKLYSNQVFVADNIKEIIPEFLLLLKGVVDCPDLPLNVSRSFLQNDGYVKKLSGYITRKVADRLTTEFNTHREDYQRYWDDIHPFVKYGCIRDEKFYDRVKDVILFKTTDGEYLTLKEYGDRAFDGDKKIVFYASDPQRQAQMIKLYTDSGKPVVLLDTMIDNNFISFMEYSGKNEVTFRRVDASMEGLTEDGAEKNEETRAALEALFRKALSDEQLSVQMEQFKSSEMPAMITVEEQSRRFTEMSRAWGGSYNLPEKRTLVLNAAHPLIRYLETADAEAELTRDVCEQVVDLAEMSRQMLSPERMVAFLARSNKLLTELAQK